MAMPIVLHFVEEKKVFEFYDINEAMFTLGTYVPKDAEEVPENGTIVVRGETFAFTKEDFKAMMAQIDEYEKIGKRLQGLPSDTSEDDDEEEVDVDAPAPPAKKIQKEGNHKMMPPDEKASK